MNESTGQELHEELKVYYSDDSDPIQAGHGLAALPLLHQVLDQSSLHYWLMCPAEQAAMLYLLQSIKPKVAIEIGTRFGGSLQLLAKCCGTVYSLDIDPAVPERLRGRFPNVEFITGPSLETLPPLLARLQSTGAELSFILVDGDHSAVGARDDVNAILEFVPTVPLYVLMHDSFNAEVRHGLKTADWNRNPHVHIVELDLVNGTVNPSPAHRNELWGGFALGVLLPSRRTGRFQVVGKGELTFKYLNVISKIALIKPTLTNFVRRLIRKVARRVRA